MRSSYIAILAMASVCIPSALTAQAPDSLSFQGRLADSLGNPITQSGLSMVFTLYKSGVSVWDETQSVDVVDGTYDVYLGAVESLDTVAFNQPMDLGIKVGTDAEMTPRTPLVAGAFALGMRGMYAVYAEVAEHGFKSLNVIGGAPNNAAGTEFTGATISGGGGWKNSTSKANRAFGSWATIGGGNNNTANGSNSTISGGGGNTTHVAEGTIGGGWMNQTSGSQTTVAGGKFNHAVQSQSTVGGGEANTAGGGASTISGGVSNTTQWTAYNSTIGGGSGNEAGGAFATVPGGLRNAARGQFSLAAGRQAKANHGGTFVWQDSTGTTDDTLASSVGNQFLVRASGGFKFLTGGAPDTLTGAELTAGSGSWASLSSKSSKTAFEDVDTRDYLDRVASLDLKEWSYKTEGGVTHVGPMAEDFYAAFGHGPSEKSISTVDADGVALAAIQGLYELVQELQAENERMRAAMERAGLE